MKKQCRSAWGFIMDRSLIQYQILAILMARLHRGTDARLLWRTSVLELPSIEAIHTFHASGSDPGAAKNQGSIDR